MPETFPNTQTGKAVFVGVGNSDRGDDGIGVKVAERLKNKISCPVFVAGETPENYLEQIVQEKPRTIFIIDAVHFDEVPGTIKFFTKRDVTRTTFSTHNAPLSVLMDYLEQATGAEVWLIGVMPKQVNFGEPMSSELEDAVRKLTETIIDFSKSKDS